MFDKKVLYIILALVLIYIAFKFFLKYKEKFTTSSQPKALSESTTQSDQKIIKFYGADYCPYSNKQSPAYKIMNDFEEEYPSVKVVYYWVGENDKEMNESNVEYVPTILTGDNKKIEIRLPEGVNKEDKTGEELKTLVLENINNQL
jgi:hypothetical protein